MALEKVSRGMSRGNSLNLLGDVSALPSSTSPLSTGTLATNNIDSVRDILMSITASEQPNKSSLDILSEVSIALRVKKARHNKF